MGWSPCLIPGGVGGWEYSPSQTNPATFLQVGLTQPFPPAVGSQMLVLVLSLAWIPGSVSLCVWVGWGEWREPSQTVAPLVARV